MSQPVSAARGHRIFAALYDRLTADFERRFLGENRALVAGPARGRVLDLGAGTGANFAHFAAGARVIAVEPDPYMLRRARERARADRRPIELLQAPAEELPFPDASFDDVVATLVLCSVDSPERALAEVRRVLTPGGALRFFEHVRAPTRGWARLQDCVAPLWGHLAGGCHPNRDTLDALGRAGFSIASLEYVQEGTFPIRPFVRGVAVRS